MRIIVTGSRTWTCRITIENALSTMPRSAIIVHGACRSGVDHLAHHAACRLGLQTEQHPADWDKHGKAAGHIRNDEMARAGADLCLAFWDGKSKGTLDMVSRATRFGIPVRIVPMGRSGG